MEIKSKLVINLTIMVQNLSLEERIFKQIQDLSSSIIRALDSLEKELSEYIEVTDNRLHKLEDKILKVESYIDASSQGLVKSIESSPPEKTISLPVTHPQEKVTTQPTAKSSATASIEQPKASHPTTPQPIVSIPEKQTQVTGKVSTPDASKMPPIPTPPSFKPVISEEKPADQSHIPKVPEIPQQQQEKIDAPQAPTAPQGEEGEKKEDDKDKKDLMSALKMIDSL